IEDKSSGQLIDIRQFLMRDGEPVVELVSGLFIRDRSKSGGSSKPKTPEETPTRDVIATDTVTVAADQPLRYAEASLDRNPIHIDEKISKAAGHPSVILHGLCTMAFASKAIVNHVLGGDPARLARLAVRFSMVVLPGDTLTTTVWRQGTQADRSTLGFEVTNQDGKKVITNGVAEVRG